MRSAPRVFACLVTATLVLAHATSAEPSQDQECVTKFELGELSAKLATKEIEALVLDTLRDLVVTEASAKGLQVRRVMDTDYFVVRVSGEGGCKDLWASEDRGGSETLGGEVESVEPGIELKWVKPPKFGSAMAALARGSCEPHPEAIPRGFFNCPLPAERVTPVPTVSQCSGCEQWSMKLVGVDALSAAGGAHPRGDGVVVAVLDSGVDYWHEDLLSSGANRDNVWWRNPGENAPGARRGHDDDGNGKVDDLIGWDFVGHVSGTARVEDARPYDDLSAAPAAAGPGSTDCGGGMSGGHGTHVTGLVSATNGNGIGIDGVAPGAEIMVLRVLDEKDCVSEIDLVDAIHYALAQKAALESAGETVRLVLSMSIGFISSVELLPECNCPSFPPVGNTLERQACLDAAESQFELLQAGIAEANEAGALMVMAAGNRNWDMEHCDKQKVYPAAFARDPALGGLVAVAGLGKSKCWSTAAQCCPASGQCGPCDGSTPSCQDVLTASAADAADQSACWSHLKQHCGLSNSNRGESIVDVAAPGIDVVTTASTENGAALYAVVPGTSFATPIVAGAAALYWSLPGHETLPASEVACAIRKSARKLDDLRFSVESGGMLDLRTLIGNAPALRAECATS